MKRVSVAVPALIAIIALNFTIVFGAEAWRILASPVAGLDRGMFASLVYGIAKTTGLGIPGTVTLAVAFGVTNLIIAVLFALHLTSRIAALRGGRVSHDLLDAGLVLVVLSTIVAATPAIMNGATEFLIHERLPLWLVGLAATLSMIERLPEVDDKNPGLIERLVAWRSHQRRSGWMVTPALRDRPALRWTQLRSDAGFVAQRIPTAKGPWFALH